MAPLLNPDSEAVSHSPNLQH